MNNPNRMLIYPDDYTGLFFGTSTVTPDGATAGLAKVGTLVHAYDPLASQSSLFTSDVTPKVMLPSEDTMNHRAEILNGLTDPFGAAQGIAQTAITYAGITLLGVALLVLGLYLFTRE